MSLLVNIEKRLGDFHLHADLSAGDGVLGLLGASGCGKSMTLQCIVGIQRPDRGRIEVDGRVLFDSERRIDLTPQKRRTGLLFQNYALFPNMTVAENIRCGLRRDRSAGTETVREIMGRFNLSALSDHYPHQLSGGQQQRAALARVLVSAPDILLLDEPFSALDSHLRFRLEQETRDILRDFGKTVVLVSHNRDEVFRLSDRIAVMDRGRVDVFGEKAAVFADPRTRAAALLTGCKNISPIEKLDEHRVLAADWGLTLRTARPVGDGRFVGIRMHDVLPGAGENGFCLPVADVMENPFSFTVGLKAPEGTASLFWEVDKDLWRALQGPEAKIHLPPEALCVLQ